MKKEDKASYKLAGKVSILEIEEKRVSISISQIKTARFLGKINSLPNVCDMPQLIGQKYKG